MTAFFRVFVVREFLSVRNFTFRGEFTSREEFLAGQITSKVYRID